MKKTLKLKKYTAYATIMNNDILTRKFFNSLLLLFGVLAMAYLLFLGIITFNIVERKTLENHARNLSNDVGVLELEYLSLAKDIDMSISHEYGFKEVKASFAYRQKLAQGVSENNQDVNILRDIRLAQNEI